MVQQKRPNRNVYEIHESFPLDFSLLISLAISLPVSPIASSVIANPAPDVLTDLPSNNTSEFRIIPRTLDSPVRYLVLDRNGPFEYGILGSTGYA